MKKIKCIIVGLGKIGNTYSKILANEKIMDLVAGCDISEKARNEFIKQYPAIPVYNSVDKVIEEIPFDAALILTPDSSHAEPFIKCLDARKHVFVEKPVGNTIDEIKEMIKAVDRNPDCHGAG